MSQVTVAFDPNGSQLLIRISGVWTEIPQLQNLKGPGISKNLADKSTLSSGGWEEVQPLMNKPTPVTANIVWDPANTAHNYLRQSMRSQPATLERFMEIASDPNATTVLFSGYVTKFDPSLSHTQVGMIDFEVTPTGAPTIYYGSSPA